MPKTKKHPTKKWEISILEFQNHKGKKFKVTRRIQDMSVAETKIFKSKRQAIKQFNGWLN